MLFVEAVINMDTSNCGSDAIDYLFGNSATVQELNHYLLSRNETASPCTNMAVKLFFYFNLLMGQGFDLGFSVGVKVF